MSWLLVPLQYLFLIWRAQKFTAMAAAAAGTTKHHRRLRKAAKAVAACEKLQVQFPEVTNWMDIRRCEQAIRFDISK